MSEVVLLDSGPLGMYAHPKAHKENRECRRRVNELLVAGAQVRAPSVAVYENRRKLVHIQGQHPAAKGLARFDEAVRLLGLVPMTEEVMRLASELWGDARHRGIVTAPPEALDGDVILAAHAFIEAATGRLVEIATTNSSDLTQLYPHVLNWDDLKT
jgi:hypothetical protein